MKIPTKTVTLYDWDALYEMLADGSIIDLDDMTTHNTRALNMWLRANKGLKLISRGLLRGGYQIVLGGPVPSEKRRYTKKALT